MNTALSIILQRRAIRAFEPVQLSSEMRELILNAARSAPSSFNIQPYRFYWIESPGTKTLASQLCMGQKAGANRLRPGCGGCRHWLLAFHRR